MILFQQDVAIEQLCEKVRALGLPCASAIPFRRTLNNRNKVEKARQNVVSSNKYGLIAISASTGGPVAIETVIKRLSATFPIPIVFNPAYAFNVHRCLCKKVR